MKFDLATAMEIMDRYITMYEIAMRYEQEDTAAYFLEAITDMMEGE